MRQSTFSAGVPPGTSWGSSQRSPDPQLELEERREGRGRTGGERRKDRTTRKQKSWLRPLLAYRDANTNF